MWDYAITQTGPALGSEQVCYMAGLQNTTEHVGQYLGDAETRSGALFLIAEHAAAIGTTDPFRITYIPWKG